MTINYYIDQLLENFRMYKEFYFGKCEGKVLGQGVC